MPDKAEIEAVAREALALLEYAKERDGVIGRPYSADLRSEASTKATVAVALSNLALADETRSRQ